MHQSLNIVKVRSMKQMTTEKRGAKCGDHIEIGCSSERERVRQKGVECADTNRF